jgi:hypothetical protein
LVTVSRGLSDRTTVLRTSCHRERSKEHNVKERK